jgi:hypothetical protein
MTSAAATTLYTSWEGMFQGVFAIFSDMDGNFPVERLSLKGMLLSAVFFQPFL